MTTVPYPATEEEKEQIEDIFLNADVALPDSEDPPEFLEQLKELGWKKVNHYLVFKDLS